VDVLNNLVLGFSVALSFKSLAFCFLGVLVGTIVGVLPGIGPIGVLAMLLPVTFHMGPVEALILLAGVYYGSQYGGSTTAILVNMPGESASVVTCLDGHQMAKRGRAGAALAAAAVGSFFAGTLANSLIVLIGPPLAELALKFGSPEYFALIVLGLVGSIVLASGSLLKALAMLCLGLLIGEIGTDGASGVSRMTMGLAELYDGLAITALAIGLFGVSEILMNLDRRDGVASISVIGRLLPSREEIRRSIPAVIRGTGLGAALGLLPGGGALLASYASYALEKRISRTPERFGHGMIEGVAGPESANNAGAQTSFIPMLTLGLPSNPVMALMIGAMILQGITPGPSIIQKQPDLFWGLIASMWIGNLILVILNLPLVGVWVAIFRIPYRLLCPVIVLICCVGAMADQNSTFNVFVLAAFSLLGFVSLKLGCEGAPLILGFILSPLLEENMRRALMLSDGDPRVLVQSPLAATLLGAALLLMLFVALPTFRTTRENAFKES
jgi:putative tricarboxylic transport membrane protein